MLMAVPLPEVCRRSIKFHEPVPSVALSGVADSSQIDKVLAKCLAKNPEERYEDHRSC